MLNHDKILFFMRMIHSVMIREKPPSKRPRIRSSVPYRLSSCNVIDVARRYTLRFRCAASSIFIVYYILKKPNGEKSVY